jgi:hypothetical protein
MGTCLLTIHGMGFQQAPAPGVTGYADRLHAALQKQLPGLGGDPVSELGRPAGEGAVYVHSEWPPDDPQNRNREQGLHRLGTWTSDERGDGDIDASKAPLFEPGHDVAHVALVYSHLEDQGNHFGASTQALVDGAVSHGRYASLLSIAHMAVVDVWAALHHRQKGDEALTPSLRVRADATAKTNHPNTDGNPSGLLSVLQALDHDVATYICRNDLRARVHDFVEEALMRLCCRDDVDAVVVNTHSLGTVLAFDTLRAMPPFVIGQVRCLVTAGSPLRKFVDLFYWGQDAGSLVGIPWRNFWDPTDPMADPLAPPQEWRRGEPPPAHSQHPHLYYAYDRDSGAQVDVAPEDLEVDNAAHEAGGGLPAHNYWDNEDEVVRRLAGFIEEAVNPSPPETLTS